MSNSVPHEPPQSRPPATTIADELGDLPRLHRMLLVTDGDGGAVWASRTLRSRCGIDGDASVLSAQLEFDGPTRADGVRDVSASLRNGKGARIAFEGCAMPLQPRGSSERLTLSILRPQAARGRCDRDLRGAVGFLSAILDSAPEAVVAFDRDGFITYANAAVERLLGRPQREALHRPLAPFVADRAELSQLAARLASGEEVHGHDMRLQLVGGGTTWVSVSARAIRTGASDGDAPASRGARGWVAFLRDVNQRKRMEDELERKNAELEHYVQTVSHDLRSPLVSLLGFSRLLRQDYGETLDETGRHFLGRIEQAGRTMETLIHDLLELSRIGRRAEERRLVDPRPILLQLQAELKPRLDERGIQLELPASPPLVLCDRTRLYQVFSNLIGNAVEHMGSVAEPRIHVEVAEHPDHHRLRVADNGRGIPAEDRERVFEIFHTRGARGDGQRASGIGLAIVKKIAETHGGRVWVEDAPGGGAAFHLLLPRR